ncbi:Electron transport complex protein RnfC [Planctomycetes bacterium CA13]|uniref:Electron transport complex protein RnfC n=1 Tax=Novipirellula herctigrandis TaxID=2527986 RepID=A0A5C5Z2S0_9BACT|nr:Electron transport complex protein RnfC [Planctomycetes bacterium CA13]
MQKKSKQDLLRLIREAGVIGAGGAGFPTYKKLDATVEHVIANGAECEPLLQKDRESMLQRQDAFFRGLQILRDLTDAATVTVAVKKKNQDVVESFQPDLESNGFESLVYPDVYPAGDEYILVYEISGRLIPPGGIPLHVGCVVDNVETIVNVALAAEGKPVVDKFVTVCGAVAEPLTTVVPIGVSIADCLELAGGLTVDDPLILTGGIMMGGVTTDLSMPVGKNMGGIIALPRDHYLAKRKTQSQETYTRIGHGQCDQCSLCTELCPRYIMGYPIEPHRVMRTLLMTGEAKQRSSLWAQYCCECNVCSMIACPEMLDPKNICVDAKQVLRENELGRTEQELEVLFRDPHPARKGREIPIPTLITRLGLASYNRKAPFVSFDHWQPQRVTIPLNSHIGAPAKPVVSVGDTVQCGDVIATVDEQQLGCPAHASLDGQVTAVKANSIEITV